MFITTLKTVTESTGNVVKTGGQFRLGREGAARRVDLYMLSRISDTRNGMFAIGTCQEGSSR